ncbi:hypothetical protein BKA62DRAFT_701774 [Auriculariales sp. MPI-PUGE-AT-0066]|nr:hypothetical protein BKA62DRAFT_701774 [Auriculariales sp. MPI-PUGE-AT-0066]
MSSSSSETARAWDQSVRECTQGFVYDDYSVCLQVEGKTFKVSKRKLVKISPVFADTLKLPTNCNEPIRLTNKAYEFESFLWYIHANYFEFADFMNNSTKPQRFDRILSIASIAHFYQCFEIIDWAVLEILDLFPACGVSDLQTLQRLYTLATRCGDQAPDLFELAQSYCYQEIQDSTDPVSWLCAAKEVDDPYLQAYAYFHILKLRNADIRDDARLSTLDRIRLHTGALNLRRFEPVACLSGCFRFSRSHKSDCDRSPAVRQNPDTWSPDPRAPLQTHYGEDSLWDMFDRSPMGFSLSTLTILCPMSSSALSGPASEEPADIPAGLEPTVSSSGHVSIGIDEYFSDE